MTSLEVETTKIFNIGKTFANLEVLYLKLQGFLYQSSDDGELEFRPFIRLEGQFEFFNLK